MREAQKAARPDAAAKLARAARSRRRVIGTRRDHELSRAEIITRYMARGAQHGTRSWRFDFMGPKILTEQEDEPRKIPNVFNDLANPLRETCPSFLDFIPSPTVNP